MGTYIIPTKAGRIKIQKSAIFIPEVGDSLGSFVRIILN